MGDATVFAKPHHFEQARIAMGFAMERAGVVYAEQPENVQKLLDNLVEVLAFNHAEVCMAQRSEHENLA